MHRAGPTRHTGERGRTEPWRDGPDPKGRPKPGAGKTVRATHKEARRSEAGGIAPRRARHKPGVTMPPMKPPGTVEDDPPWSSQKPALPPAVPNGGLLVEQDGLPTGHGCLVHG